LECAVARPGLIGALVLHGVEARFHVGLAATIARRVLERFPLPSDNGFVNQFFNLLYGGKPEPGPVLDFLIERCWETDQAVMASRIRALESFDVSSRVWQIDAPSLIIAGSRDVVVPPSRQKHLADAIPGAGFETLEGAGHIGFLTHSREVAQHIRQLRRTAQRLAR
jgi:pimeloyl-ACP methyl ester carboxylesterase